MSETRAFSAARLLLCLLLAALILSPGLFAAADGAKLSVTAGAAEKDGTVPVSVDLSEGSNAAIIQFALKYDPEELECLSASPGALLSGHGAPTVNTSQSGYVFFVWDSLTPVTEGGALMTLKVKPLKAGAELSVDMTKDFVMANSSFTAIGTVTEDCLVGDPAASAAPAAAAGAQSGVNSGLTLNENSVSLPPQSTRQLEVAEGGQGVVWTSSNEDVVSVVDGVVTAQKLGSATVTASTEDGLQYATCHVEVEPPTSPAVWIIPAALVLLGGGGWWYYKKKKKAPESGIDISEDIPGDINDKSEESK